MPDARFDDANDAQTAGTSVVFAFSGTAVSSCSNTLPERKPNLRRNLKGCLLVELLPADVSVTLPVYSISH